MLNPSKQFWEQNTVFNQVWISLLSNVQFFLDILHNIVYSEMLKFVLRIEHFLFDMCDIFFCLFFLHIFIST
jgi:hypothetical protein